MLIGLPHCQLRIGIPISMDELRWAKSINACKPLGQCVPWFSSSCLTAHASDMQVLQWRFFGGMVEEVSYGFFPLARGFWIERVDETAPSCVRAWFSDRWWSVGKYLRFITKAGGCSQEVIPEYQYLQCFGAGVWYTIKLMISACGRRVPRRDVTPRNVYVSSGKKTLRFLENFTFPQ